VPKYEFSRILVAIADPSADANKAVRRAGALALGTGARVELFNAIPTTMSAGNAHAAAEHFTRCEVERNKRNLERAANRLRRQEIVVEINVQTGYPVHEAILREIRLTNPNLVIIEARKHTPLARLLLTQTDFELIRHCPVPLLIVKGRTAWRRPRIIAALDPFHRNDKPRILDREILGAARALAGATHGTVRAVHIYQPLFHHDIGLSMRSLAPRALIAQERAHRAAIRTAFYAALTRLRASKAQARSAPGDPSRDLPILARTMGASVIVLGAVSRSGLKRIFIGNTAERVLDSGHCDVLVVKSGPRNCDYEV
jgi:universal stress protein E